MRTPLPISSLAVVHDEIGVLVLSISTFFNGVCNYRLRKRSFRLIPLLFNFSLGSSTKEIEDKLCCLLTFIQGHITLLLL